MIRSLSCIVVLALAAPASADIFRLFAELDGGAAYGKGTGVFGRTKDDAFFAKAPHAAYGVLIGGEYQHLGAWIQHHQFTDGSRVMTWTQVGAGFHAQLDFGAFVYQGFIAVSAGAWLGLGTSKQVDPPLDDKQITDKALLLEGRLSIGKHLSFFDVGISVPVSGGYFIKNSISAIIASGSLFYRGVQGEALLFLRANLPLL